MVTSGALGERRVRMGSGRRLGRCSDGRLVEVARRTGRVRLGLAMEWRLG